MRREVLDHPAAAAAIEDTCATCHMPMARYEAVIAGGRGEVFASLAPDALRHAAALDGVSCVLCHRIGAANLGAPESFDGGFVVDAAAERGERAVFGPYEIDRGRRSVMQSAAEFVPTEAAHVQRSELCATCHTLYTHALNERGEPVGELPEQVPYREWLHSDYRESQSCQDCHMPEVSAGVPISSVLGEPRARVSRHTFRGGNAFMLALLGKYRGELGVEALPHELEAAAAETRRYLGTAAATLALAGARRGAILELDVAVTSTTGHKLPTAYPSRRAWLHVVVSDVDGRVVFESGAVRPDGSIVGNDADADGATFEPHYREIHAADEVQIYESIMVDQTGTPTTGLLRAVRYIKDNRLLPRGFDKRSAPEDVAVRGAAGDDPDFASGGDRVRYRIEIPGDAHGSLRVNAELLYQSIGYRWAANLLPYDAPETRRFTGFYRDTSGAATATLATAALKIR